MTTYIFTSLFLASPLLSLSPILVFPLVTECFLSFLPNLFMLPDEFAYL